MLLRVSGWILLAALTGAPGMVHAQSDNKRIAAPSDSSGGNAALMVERQRLRTDLDRINGEIDAMKREDRGLRDDYRLRNRMADAEALARRLTEVDARLQASSGASGLPGAARAASRTPWPAAPEAQPSDDRATLEAKADILADQARRLNTQADLLAGRVTDLRARQELRRRAGQLERDPFSQLEQSKRRLAASGTSSVLGTTPGTKEVPASSPTPTRGDTSGTPMIIAGTPTGAPAAASPTPPGGPSLGVTGSATGVGSHAAGGGEKPQPSLVSPGTTAGDASAASVSTQFRGILDASTLAEIRRLEIAGSPSGSVPAMERALSALRARAAQLTANSNDLRSRAKVAP